MFIYNLLLHLLQSFVNVNKGSVELLMCMFLILIKLMHKVLMMEPLRFSAATKPEIPYMTGIILWRKDIIIF